MNVRMINTIGRWLASCLLLFMVSSCIDDGFESASQGVIDENGMVHLSIQTNVPGLKVTRAVDINGEGITTLWVLSFNEYGNMISRVLATQTNNVQGTAGGTGTFTASVPSSTRILHFLANVNMDNFSDQSNIGRHENEVIAPLVSSSGNLVYWGRREFSSQVELTNFAANSVDNPVLLYRTQALIQYEVSSATGITLEVEGWAICNQYAYGTVAPFDASALGDNSTSPFRFDLGTFDYVTEVPETYRVKQRDDDEVATASGVVGDPRYIFENANVEDDQVFVIIRIKKTENGDSSDKYYKILVVDDKKVPYPIIRNHKYTVKITNVNESYGVDTYEEALTATPANNPWITISDEIPEVINGSTTLRIEGETTVVYQKAGQYTIDFYYNGTSKPVVEWLSNDGIAAPVSDGDITWDESTKKGTITLNVNSPVEGQVSYATLQIKESDGFLSRRVKVISSEPFSFSPTWVSSEIPLLDNEDITLLFRIPDDFPDELLPVEVKFGCDLIDGQVGQPLKVVNEETVYSSMPVYNAGTQQWETQVISTDWNYKYVYTATQKGIQRVNFRTILTNLTNIDEAQREFHIYMEGCTAKSGQELFEQRDLYFAFQYNSASSYSNRYRIMLEEGDANRKFTSRTIEDLEPIYGESIEIPFTLGTLRTDENATSSWNNDVVSATDVDAQVWVYYDPALVTPQWGGTTGIDAYGNNYMVYNTTTAENTLFFNTLSPNFDCYIVLAAKSRSGYGQGTPSPPEMGVNERGYRSASVTIRSSGRFDFEPAFSTDGNVFTPVNGGGSFSIPYGTEQDVWLRIQVPVAAQDKAFQFKLGTKYLEPVDQTQWTKWTTAEGDGWTYTFTANETTGTKDFHFKTTRLSSEETLSLSSGNYVGFNPLTVDMLNKQLTGTIRLPEGTQFSTGSPYIILERASDGTRIGTFDLGEASLVWQTEADYYLTLRGEYNLTETDRINVKWSPVTSNEIYIYSGLLRDLLTDGRTIELQLQQ